MKQVEILAFFVTFFLERTAYLGGLFLISRKKQSLLRVSNILEKELKKDYNIIMRKVAVSRKREQNEYFWLHKSF